MRNTAAKKMAVSGVLAALAVVFMTLGGLIPIATYVCPLICMVLGCFVLRLCGNRYAWTWYVAVSILSVLLGPDKEAAAVYVFMGYYPLIKQYFDKLPLGWLVKLLYFNVAVMVLYGALIFLLGLSALYTEFKEAGVIGSAVLLVLGNITFILADKVLGRFITKR